MPVTHWSYFQQAVTVFGGAFLLAVLILASWGELRREFLMCAKHWRRDIRQWRQEKAEAKALAKAQENHGKDSGVRAERTPRRIPELRRS